MNACLPVALAMMARGWDVQFLALTTAYGAVEKTQVPVWQARDLVGADEEDILAHGLRLVGEAPDGAPENSPVSREETIAYHALGYHDLIASYGEKGAAALYEKRGRGAFEHHALGARIIDRVQPDLVLTTNSPRAEKAVIDCAQRRGIPAVVLNDTLASTTNEWLHNPDYADQILVIADPVRDILIASGHAPQKIIVTGNPALEPMARLREERRGRASEPRKVVLYASQPLLGADATHKTELVAELHRIAAARSDIELRVRLHPSEGQAADWLKPAFSHHPGATLSEDLRDADALVTHGSTVGIEAALAGIPVVLQMGSSVAEKCRFEEYGIAMPARTVTDLAAAIDRALSLGVASSHVASFSMPSDATGNVVAAIEEVINAG